MVPLPLPLALISRSSWAENWKEGGGGFEGRRSSKTWLTRSGDGEESMHGHWGLSCFPDLGFSDSPTSLHEDGFTFPSFLNKYLFIYLFIIYLFRLRQVLVAACGIFIVARMRDLVPWPGIKPGPPALGAQSLTHWTTREVPASTLVSLIHSSLIGQSKILQIQKFKKTPRNF